MTTSTRPAIYVTVAVGRTSITFLVDSGSSVSIITQDLFRQHFEGQTVSDPRIRLLEYSKKSIPIGGCFVADVTITAQQVFFYVVEQGTSLLGIDAIKALGLQIDGSSLNCLEATSLRTGARTEQSPVKAEGQQPINLPAELAEEFAAIFDPGLGIANGLCTA